MQSGAVARTAVTQDRTILQQSYRFLRSALMSSTSTFWRGSYWPCSFCLEARSFGGPPNGRGESSHSRAHTVCSPKLVKTRAPQFADAFVNENAHLVGHQPGLRVDDLHRQWVGLELFQHVFELAALSVGRDHVRQEHAQAHAVDAGIDRRIDLIAGDDAIDRNGLLPLANLKMPFA